MFISGWLIRHSGEGEVHPEANISYPMSEGQYLKVPGIQQISALDTIQCLRLDPCFAELCPTQTPQGFPHRTREKYRRQKLQLFKNMHTLQVRKELEK